MAETQLASVGYMGAVFLHNGTTLFELKQVKGFDIPNLGEREQVETTHLKTPSCVGLMLAPSLKTLIST